MHTAFQGTGPPARAAVVGGGPAGLTAATRLRRAGLEVAVYEAMPSVGRKLLVAGKGGLNLTHSEPLEAFASRYGPEEARFRDLLRRFGPDDLRAFAAELGIPTKVGTSGRVFPEDGRAAPLLRAWVRELKAAGVAFHVRHRLVDLGPGPRLELRDAEGAPIALTPAVAVLALGGASWRRLGSDGLWTRLLARHGVTLRPFVPSNCGFEVPWSKVFRERAEGHPLKNVAVSFDGRRVAGELLVTAYGLEGGAIYALSPALRSRIAERGEAVIELDLKPALDRSEVERRLRGAAADPRRSLGARLQRALSLPSIGYPLLREAAGAADLADPATAAARVKALPLPLRGVRPLDEAISSAGGVAFAAVDDALMLRALPGIFVCGEMLDYDPPTGGYLLQAAFATGARAAEGAVEWLGKAWGESGALS